MSSYVSVSLSCSPSLSEVEACWAHHSSRGSAAGSAHRSCPHSARRSNRLATPANSQQGRMAVSGAWPMGALGSGRRPTSRTFASHDSVVCALIAAAEHARISTLSMARLATRARRSAVSRGKPRRGAGAAIARRRAIAKLAAAPRRCDADRDSRCVLVSASRQSGAECLPPRPRRQLQCVLQRRSRHEAPTDGASFVAAVCTPYKTLQIGDFFKHVW